MQRKNKGIPNLIERSFALTILGFSFPTLLLLAFLIKVTSKGPAVFKQQRVGKEGEIFVLYKLRTMKVNRSRKFVTSSNDDRITMIGKYLRKLKLDELPQLWNVAKGDLSLVGPRPEVPDLVNLSDPLWLEVLSVMPGLTDPVTIKLRNEESLMESVVGDKDHFYKNILQPYKLKGYIEYLEKRTWKSDIFVLFQTIAAIFRSRRNVLKLEELIEIDRLMHIPNQ